MNINKDEPLCNFDYSVITTFIFIFKIHLFAVSAKIEITAVSKTNRMAMLVAVIISMNDSLKWLWYSRTLR